MNSKKIITDKPEILNLKNDGYVAVPTITDAIILKTDIIKFSESGLREKDKADIAVLFNIAIKKKMHIDNIIDELMRVQDNHVDRIKILNEIKSLLSTTFRSQFKSEFFPNKEDSIKIEALLNRQLVMFEPFVNKPGQNRIYKKTSR